LYFDSLNYWLFFPVVWVLFLLVPSKRRWAVLLAASIIFYAALRAPLLLFALATVVVVSYCCGRYIEGSTDASSRRIALWTGIATNAAILCGIKYLRIIVGAVLPPTIAPTTGSHWLVTIGVSFYTLQGIAYLVDIYMGMVTAERHFGRFALYLAFFPKLLQGPIERAGDLLPQLEAPGGFHYENARSGLLRLGWGLFKKVAVANRLAPFVNAVYSSPHNYGSISLIVATYMYAIQIYADFSGYTDMALGVARLFNIRLTENFNAPYLATSVADFWRRWHISFSRWILDYIFKPLQIKWRDAKVTGVAAALMVTFVFSGFWHGVALTFVIWGALHGLYMAIAVLLKPWRNVLYDAIGMKNRSIRKVIQVVITFNLVAFAWIFFRANSIGDAAYIATHLFAGSQKHVSYLGAEMQGIAGRILNPIMMDQTKRDFVLLCLSVGLMFAGSFLKNRINLRRQPVWLRWSAYYALLLAIIYLSVYDSVGFVYFQF
jgi:D-alanyl-lipoteichoic acid acyltransferase DltB (MBOAT superfamily)